ncbi:component of IIS longevity pathway SMK-1-domain-containing protein [Ephemerocybe angulata]|uniref:Component of IIS longevity pathway SMK-1-domain-containing protein n=1 Tax=Ephemerocybe angulata TaxID=980116 RepID=A0A8H6MAJ2_9AGAR|nr:component of IIS longevity pathway SMK-1-domain-containing protein [Tulosesus angulatus]
MTKRTLERRFRVSSRTTPDTRLRAAFVVFPALCSLFSTSSPPNLLCGRTKIRPGTALAAPKVPTISLQFVFRADLASPAPHKSAMDLPPDVLPNTPQLPNDAQTTPDTLHNPDNPSATSSHVSPDTTPTTDHAAAPTTDETSESVMMDDADAGADGAQEGTVAGVGDKEEDTDTEIEIGPQPAIVKEEGEVSLDHGHGQIEMLEHTQGYMGQGDGSGILSETEEWAIDNEHELKRVKVYELVGARWMDQGTAFCFGQFSEESNEALLIARSERNYHEVVLSTIIRGNDVYQRQQDTLIVWTEPDGVDYALSFQDPDGCTAVWDFIQEVQRHMGGAGGDNLSSVTSSPLIGAQEASVTTASILRSGHLPVPTLGIINEIERAIKVLSRTAAMKERICEYIQAENYIKSLIRVMHHAEQHESLEDLHALCGLMQSILMLNDHGMYEHIMDDDIFFGVTNPTSQITKLTIASSCTNNPAFTNPSPIRDSGIQRKIHNAYRLQFLKDVVLARIIDDSTFNVINSCILFNQIDIISHVQHDPHFLRDLISLFVDEAIFFPGKKPPHPQQQQQPHQHMQGHLPPNQIIISLNWRGGRPRRRHGRGPQAGRRGLPRPYKELRQYYQHHYSFAPRHDLSEADINLRREVIILLQQLCVMGKNVQLPARLALFRNLVDRGIVFAVQWAISLPDKEDSSKAMISAGGEVLSTLLDHDLEWGAVAYKAETLLDVMCRIMATTKDMAIQSQIGDALKTWLEPNGPPKSLAVRKEGDTERFLDYFYKNCVNVLFKPLMELPEWKNIKEPILPLYREEANRFTYLADLFHSFVIQHGFRSHLYSISSNILGRIVSLLKAKDKHLRTLYLLKQNNPVSTNMMCKLDVFQPILELTLQESRRDNLLSCSCQELFDSMRRENVKELIKFCMTHHEDLIRKLARTPLGGQRFELFIKRYEINCPSSIPDRGQGPAGAWSTRKRRTTLMGTEEDEETNAVIPQHELVADYGAPFANTTYQRDQDAAAAAPAVADAQSDAPAEAAGAGVVQRQQDRQHRRYRRSSTSHNSRPVGLSIPLGSARSAGGRKTTRKKTASKRLRKSKKTTTPTASKVDAAASGNGVKSSPSSDANGDKKTSSSPTPPSQTPPAKGKSEGAKTWGRPAAAE